MRRPPWYVSIPQPARWTVVGAILFGGMGAIGGFVEAVDLYPLRSWFGVTSYVAVLAGLAGALLGVVCGLVPTFVSRWRGRRRLG